MSRVEAFFRSRGQFFRDCGVTVDLEPVREELRELYHRLLRDSGLGPAESQPWGDDDQGTLRVDVPIDPGEGTKLLAALENAVGDHPSVVEVRGRGLMVGVELDGVPSSRVVAEALDRGVWIYPGGSGAAVNDGLLFAPPMIIEDDDVGKIVDVTQASIDAIT